ncbi:MAG TPA: polysaccharide biosynthesis C-terminal domain-containing protein [Halococcus sp.]|nr:polysaccharide biosynthesis C-terminal domain-containing protein [Halococcus sp.]
MKYSAILRSSLGTFATRIGLSVVVFLGVFYLAAAEGPVVLGVYSLFLAVVRVVDIMTNVGFAEAAEKRISEATERDEFFTAMFSVPSTERDEFFTATLLVRLFLFAPVALVVFVFRGAIASYVGGEMVIPFLLVGSFGYLVRRTLEAGLVGEKKVARAGAVTFVFAIGQLGSWLVLIPLGYGLFGVFLGYVIGQVLGIFAGLFFLTLRPKKPSIERFRSLVRFAKYGWIGPVTDQSWVWTDTLVLGVFVVPALVGVYELSWQITGVLFLLASAISSTVFATISDLSGRGDTDQITDLLERSLVYTGIMAIPGLVGGIIFAEPILAAFGEEYRVGAVVIPVLILARVFHSYEVVFSKVIDALDRPDLTLRSNTAFVVTNIVLNVVAIAAVGWVGAAIATTVAMLLKTGLSYHYIRSILAFSLPVKEILMEVCAALVMGACLLVLIPASTVPILETVVFIGLGAVIYAVSVLVLVERIRDATMGAFYELLVRTQAVNN